MIAPPSGMGLVVSPGNVPSASELAQLRPAFLRSILYTIADLDPLLDTGLPILLTINNQMAEMQGWSGAEDVARLIARRGQGRVFAVNWGNEFDLYWKDNPNDVTPRFAAELVRRVAPALRDAGIAVIPTSLAGPRWPEYLAALAPLCRDVVDYFDVHPYGQKPDGWRPGPWFHGELKNVIRQASAIAGKPIICSEYGVKLGDAGGQDEVASFLVAADKTFRAFSPDVYGGFAAWFAWRDQVGMPHERGDAAFGLRNEEGVARAAWYAFAGLPKAAPRPSGPVTSVWPDPIAPNARFVLGFRAWAEAEPELIGAPHDAREWGAALGISQQRTTNGLLTWADLNPSKSQMLFIDGRNGRRYRWMGGQSQEVA